MKLHKIFLVILLASTNSFTFAQTNKPTQKETEDWLLEKLNRYSIPYTKTTLSDSYMKYYDFNFSFQNEYLIITNKTKEKIESIDYHFDMQCDDELKISVLDLLSISSENTNKEVSTTHLIFHCSDKAQKYKSTCTLTVNGKKEFKEYIGTSYSFFYLGFRTDGEKDIVLRLNKALSTLKSFYKTKKEKF